jgi:polyisoprenoid-binding protein YceI
MHSIRVFIAGAGSALTILIGCTSSDEAQSATIDTTSSTSSGVLAALPAAGTRYVVASSGNEVRYRVREQLAGFDLPNDAVGKSTAVSGAIALDDAGTVIREASRFVIDAATFVSDRDRRDNYVRGRLLESARYPSVVFVPTEARGLALPRPGTSTQTFEVLGDLTVRGVTRPTTWRVTAKIVNSEVSGSATTKFAFTEFEMQKPQVRSVLSVADTIALEYDFRLVREEGRP